MSSDQYSVETLRGALHILELISGSEICLSAARTQYQTYMDTGKSAFLEAAEENLQKARQMGAIKREVVELETKFREARELQ